VSRKNGTFREQLRAAWPRSGPVPSFDDAWRAAARRARSTQRRYRHFAVAATLAAAAVAGLNLQGPRSGPYIELAEFMESTYWSAPSDVLLPDPEFDIYQELPVLFESTDPAGGALL
jgi:hypothetical protein